MQPKSKPLGTWVGGGWDWFALRTSMEVTVDAREMENLAYWIKSKGKAGDLQARLT